MLKRNLVLLFIGIDPSVRQERFKPKWPIYKRSTVINYASSVIE